MTNYKLDLCYCGKHFAGSQIQPDQRTVEGELEKAIAGLYENHYHGTFSGRTDSGVHAEHQVYSIQLPDRHDTDTIVKALNAKLPHDVRILSISPVSETFNARYSATSREYHYLFSTEPPPIYLTDRITHLPYPVTLDKIEELLNTFIGKHDFTAFRNLGSNDTTPIRTILDCAYVTEPATSLYPTPQIPLHRIRIKANSFLYRMVRNMMGVIFEVIRGQAALNDVKGMLETGNKLISYTTAPAHGLSLVSVNYDNV